MCGDEGEWDGDFYGERKSDGRLSCLRVCRMEQLIEAAAGTGGGGVDLRQEPRAVAICARFARHTRHGQAVLGAWHMFRTLEPRLRTHLVYEEIMVSLFLSLFRLCGADEALA